MRSAFLSLLLAPSLKIPSLKLPINDALRPDPPNLLTGTYFKDRFAVPPPQPGPLIYSAGGRMKKTFR